MSLPSHPFQDDNSLTKYVSIVQVVHYFTLHKTIFYTLKWKNNYVHFLSPNFLQRKNLGTWFIPNKNEVFAWRGGGLFQVPPKEIDFFKWKLKERIRAMNFFFFVIYKMFFFFFFTQNVSLFFGCKKLDSHHPNYNCCL